MPPICCLGFIYPCQSMVSLDSASRTSRITPSDFGTYAGPRTGHAHTARPLYNLDITIAASILSKFNWAVYGFNGGLFSSTIMELGMPFNIVLACIPYANGWALFKEISLCPTILSSAPALLNHICASRITSSLTGCLIHSHQNTSTEPTHRFWEI
jgi:hypothetical protein